MDAQIINFMSRYTIYADGKPIIRNLKGWRNALNHAERWETNLFTETKRKIEILNIWTGEIVTLEEAKERAKNWRTLVAPHKATVRT